MVIAPAQVCAATSRQFADVFDHDARQECGRVLSMDLVLVQRTDVDQASRIAQRVVLALVARVI